MKVYAEKILIKVYAEDGYLGKQIQEQIYRESWWPVTVPDEMVTHDSDTKAIITPEIMAFVISNVSDRTRWEIISCKVTQL